MKNLTLALMALALASCTRPPSGLGFFDLTQGASRGVDEFLTWVAEDDRTSAFPNGLCLAALNFDVKVTDLSTKGANISIPLAAPTAGLTTVFDYDLTLSEEKIDQIVVPFVPAYLEARKKEEYEPDYEAFLKRLPTLQPRDQIRTPKAPKDSVYGPVFKDDFMARTDLAAELWRIREALHGVVLNTRSNGTLLLRPNDMTLDRTFTVIRDSKGTAKINIVTGASATLSAGRKETGINKMKIQFAFNQSKDQMRCDNTSLKKPEPEKKPNS